MAKYKNNKASEPKFPVPNRIIYTGRKGGTFTVSPNGNKEYFGNNGK